MRHTHVLALLLPLMLGACADRTGDPAGTEDAMQTASDTNAAGDDLAGDGAAPATASDSASSGTPADARRGVSAPAPTEMPTDPAEPDRASAPPMSDPLPPTRRTCNADAAAGHVGSEATPAVVSAAQRDAGASTARVLKPGQMVTMEYIEGRLNIDVDANNVITGIRCG